jgi:predicted transcriptional regulator with HTH domain
MLELPFMRSGLLKKSIRDPILLGLVGLPFSSFVGNDGAMLGTRWTARRKRSMVAGVRNAIGSERRYIGKGGLVRVGWVQSLKGRNRMRSYRDDDVCLQRMRLYASKDFLDRK